MKGQYSCTLRHFKIILLLHVTTKKTFLNHVYILFSALHLKKEMLAPCKKKRQCIASQQCNENFTFVEITAKITYNDNNPVTFGTPTSNEHELTLIIKCVTQKRSKLLGK